MSDLLRSIERLTQYYTQNYTLGGTLAAQDYVGDTTGDTGVPMPEGRVTGVYVSLAGTDDGNSTVVLENETTGTTATVTLDADTYTADETVDLYFSEGDELSISVGAVTTPGNDANVTIHQEVKTAPMR